MITFGQYARGFRRLAIAWLRGDHEAILNQQRLLAFRLLEGQAEQIAFTRSGIKWTVDVAAGEFSKKLFIRNNSHEAMRKGFIAWLKAHGHINDSRRTLIDIGANIGTPALQFANETDLNVLSIEPVPSNFELLQKNIAQNGFEARIRCVRAAVSARPGVLKMAVPKERGGCEVLEEGGTQHGFGKLTPDIPIIEVPSQRLETILSENNIANEDVAVVWCDAQGLEREIIESAPALWKSGVPMFIELWPKGINAHGGLDLFFTGVQAHFKSFLLISEIMKKGPEASPRPIGELRKVLDSIGSRHDDALLINER